MSYTAEKGNFEGRARAAGGFGNETGQTDRRGRSGEAQAANRNAINRAAALSAPTGPFKSPMYDASWQNLAKLAEMVGPMIASPGIGFAAPLAKSIISGDPYGAFGVPRGWSSYSQRDINPMGSNPRGNIGGRDVAFGMGSLTQAQRDAILSAALRRPHYERPKAPIMAPNPHPEYQPVAIGDQVSGLPYYGAAGPGYDMAAPRYRKASGYGGAARPAPIAFPPTHA